MSERWTTEPEEVDPGRARKVRILEHDEVLSFRRAAELWQAEEESFTRAFVDAITEAPWDALRWETPPVTSDTFGRPFEFVLLRSDMLARPQNAAAFSEHFTGDHCVTTFPNLGGDALMVVPTPTEEGTDYAHLAAFLRTASPDRVSALWREVGAAMTQRVGEAPIWLSTAGMGVAWLHVRLDSRPKYYGWTPYRRA